MVTKKGFGSILVIHVILIIALLLIGTVYLTKIKPTKFKAPPTPNEKLNQTPINVIFPFIRDEKLYLYERGEEKLINSAKHKSDEDSCYGYAYPFLSPNGKFIAFIEFQGKPPGYGGCREGILQIMNLESQKIENTTHEITYFKWNSDNLLIFYLNPSIERSKKTSKQIFYDPEAKREQVYRSVYEIKSNGAEEFTYGEYPYNENKQIIYEFEKYYLIEKQTKRRALLFGDSRGKNFLDWSPNGQIAIFTENAHFLAVDTEKDVPSIKEIGSLRSGGAGGDIPTGPKWYFNKGFVYYCEQRLFFVDGSEPLELTRTPGGGCHNEEGFVSTSPNGEFTFIKFNDRFEIQSKDGAKKVIKESIPITKSRHTPQNLIWLNNDYMIIFESTYADRDKLKIFLFDRVANTIKAIVEDGYLQTGYVGI